MSLNMKVLVVEDDRILSDTIKQCIQKEYDVEQAYDGQEGILFAEQDIYDVIILDLMMPIMDGYQVVSELRNKKITTPVLILTAKDGINDKVKGFKSGADDYLVKPFEKEELLARIEAMVRRNNRSYLKDEINFKDIRLDLKQRKAWVGENEIQLQGKQFDVLEYLVNYKNTIITKEQIFDKIWFNSETTGNVTEVYTSGIRKELKKYGYDKYLKTVRGVGYILSE